MPREVIRLNPGTTADLLNNGEMVRQQDIESTVIIEDAKNILGPNFIGPVEISKALRITVALPEVPKIPFSIDELKRANELDQSLIMRVSKTMHGEDITIDWLEKHMQPIFDKSILGRFNQVFDKSYFTDNDELYVISEVPRSGWALVSNKLVPQSTGINYLGQTNIIKDYLERYVFKGTVMPLLYSNAIKQFNLKMPELDEKLGLKDTWLEREVADSLIELELTRLTRQTAVEAVYDYIAYVRNKGFDDPIDDIDVWTASKNSESHIITLDSSFSLGVRRNVSLPSGSSKNGVRFSRMF